MTSIDAPSPRLHEHAAENLRFIRDTMARAANFTAVPGRGGVLMGVLAFAAAINTSRWWNCSDSSRENETIVTSIGNAPFSYLV